MKISIKVKYKAKFISEINEIGQIFFEDGTILKRKDCNEVEFICDSCNKSTIWKSFPSKEYLLKEYFLCRSCRQLGNKNSQFGKKWSEDRKVKRSEQMIGEKNHMYQRSFYDVWVEKYGKDKSDELLEDHRIRSKKIGHENGMFAKSFYDIWLKIYGKKESDRKLIEFKLNKSKWLSENKDHHNKMIINSHIKKYRKTSIEKIIEDFLKYNTINFKYNFILNNKYQFDFFIKDINLIIEAHGDYWHANPLYYSITDEKKKKLNETQLYKINLDEVKSEYAKKNGYSILCIWETDIKNGNYKKILKDYGIY